MAFDNIIPEDHMYNDLKDKTALITGCREKNRHWITLLQRSWPNQDAT